MAPERKAPWLREDTLETGTVPKLLKESAEFYGDRVALREKDMGIWQNISWTQYYRRAAFFGLGLLGLGFKPKDRLSILSENNPEWLYADIGAQGVGGITVGIYPTNVAGQVEYILEHSESTFVVVGDQEQADKVLEVRDGLPLLKKVIVIDMKGLRKYKDPILLSLDQVLAEGRREFDADPGRFGRLVEETEPLDTALMVYTSGTTGKPKGAMISHRNAVASAINFVRSTPLFECDSVVSYLPLCHIAERSFSVFYPLVVGGITVNFAESLETVQENIREIAPSIFFAVPRIWEKMHSGHLMRMRDASPLKRTVEGWLLKVGSRYALKLEKGESPGLLGRFLNLLGYLAVFRPMQKQFGLNRARVMYAGGAPTPPEVFRFFKALGLTIRDLYGSTECTGICSVHIGDDIKIGTSGAIAPGVELKISEDGELVFKSEGVFQGYYRNPEATAEVVRGGWYFSGDVGRLSEEGHLMITGRKKDIIITSGGKNISPQEIENEFKASPFIKDAVVIGDGRKYLTALILIEYDNVGKHAEDHGVGYTTFKDLTGKPIVHDLVAQVTKEVNTRFSRVETIKKFAILDKELDQDDDELTATQKVRRTIIEEKYKEVISGLYS